MAERYQNRSFPADPYGRNAGQQGRPEGDPLAELARLIGQADPSAAAPRMTARSVPEHYEPAGHYEPEAEYYDEPVTAQPAAPSWMRRANVQPPPAPMPEQDEFDVRPVHPLHRYAAQAPHQPEPREPQAYRAAAYQPASTYAEPEEQPDPSRYDDALYGQLEAELQDYQREPAYAEDSYAYQGEYAEQGQRQAPRRRGGMLTVAAVLALGVVGTGGAFAYRSFVGTTRSGEPPIIRADNTPTKIMPTPGDGGPKLPDRMASADASEKIVPREETPVDISARATPRVVFPPLNANGNAPATRAAPVAQTASIAPSPSTGMLPGSEPLRVKTIDVRGDQADSGVPPTAAPPATKLATPPKAAAVRNVPVSVNTSANAPLSLLPTGEETQAPSSATRLASTNPTQTAPRPSASAAAAGGYLVQVSSQRSEQDAQASYRSLQSKFPSVLGSRPPVIKRADLGQKGTYYRAMVGPFASSEEAGQFCGGLKSAGGQCVVQRN
jgi:sporulation related protein